MNTSITRSEPKGRWAEFAAAALRFAERRAGPVLDLFIRLWLAQTFFVSGVLKAGNWGTALFLAEHEYPVSWMDPVTAAYLGAAIELVCPVLLALGLATRFAAIPMLILALVIQLNYQALDAHLFWAALFGWYVVHGAGPLSLDRSLRKGLADSALPLAASILRGLAWVTTRMGPMYQLGLRLWLAAGIAAAFTFMPESLWLPTASGAASPAILAAACAVLLALGLASRVAALALMAALAAVEMTGPGADEARAAVAACLYPPRGRRGTAVSSVRASSYGMAPDYVATCAENLLIACQIESAKAVENIDDILAVDGIDLIFIGPFDLSATVGQMGNLKHPEVARLIGRAEERIKAAGRPMGTVPHPGCTWKDMFDRGYQFVNAGSDIARLRDGALADVKSFRGLYRKD